MDQEEGAFQEYSWHRGLEGACGWQRLGTVSLKKLLWSWEVQGLILH